MFVQVIKGHVSDAGQLRHAADRWMVELSPGASGWLGSTLGVTDDGTCFAFARFASAEQARANSDRPEQGEWWAETSKLFDGEPVFVDSSTVLADIVGEPDSATFVQVMQGRTNNPTRAMQIMSQRPDEWAAFRPDVLGSLMVDHGDGNWTMAIYFTSEADAREGERKEVPPQIAQEMSELDSLSEGEPQFFDIREPWLYSPAG